MRLRLSPQLLFFLPLLLIACAPKAPVEQPTILSTTLAKTAVPSQEILAPAVADAEPEADTEILTKTAAPADTATPTPSARLEPITMPVSVYIVDEASGTTNGSLSSGRSAEDLEPIFDLVNEIWAPAAINLEVQSIQRLVLPSKVVQAFAAADFGPFFDGIRSDFSIPEPSLINAFYTREIGGPNGIVPFRSRLFFVADEPSVHRERVTSHEIGHILGLHHTLRDADRLMFPGTNGVNLTQEEIVVARYVAQGLLDRVR